jgi:hypothetical protein
MPTESLRRRNFLTKTSAIVGTVAVTVLGVAQLEGQLASIFPKVVHPGFFNVPIELALGALAVAAVLWLCARLDRRGSTQLYLSGDLDSGELTAFRAFAVQWFGESFASERRLGSWIEKRHVSIVVVRKSTVGARRRTEEIRSFYILLPLTEAAVKLYTAGDIDGASFLPDHVVGPLERPYGLYVAGIAGSDGQANSSALLLLHRALLAYMKSGVQVILARPTTARGQKLAEDFGMRAIPGTELDGHPLYRRMV